MRTRTLALWGAFLAAHAWVAWLGWVLPSQPMGDVVLVYEPWASSALQGGAVMGLTETWVYPQLALVPMLLAKLLAVPLSFAGGTAGYLLAWAVLVTAADAAAFAVLLGRSPGRTRRAAGWFWVGALMMLGPIALYRIDAVTVPIAVVGGLWLARRPRLAAALLALGAWVKVWPGALVLAAVAAGRKAWQMAGTAVLVTAALVAVFFLLGADTELFGFLTEQSGRGLQIEAVAATPFLWMVPAGTASIDYSFDILTYQVTAPGVDVVAALLTPQMVLLVAGLAALGVVQARRGAHWQRLFPPLALSIVLALIIANKVGSPQFQTWLLATVILWIVFDREHSATAAAGVLMLCALTFAIYPLTYDGLLRAEILPLVLLTVRDVLLLALLAHTVVALVRVPIPSRP